MVYDNKFKQAFMLIENSAEFKEIDENISTIFYTLYAKTKQLYYAMCTLKDSNVQEVTYNEILPLARAFVDVFFHICYVMDEKDTKKIKEGYEYLSEVSQSITASKLKMIKDKGDLTKGFIDTFDKNIEMPNKYKFLEKPILLAKKTGKQLIWAKYYNILNSSLHFNPAIVHNYGFSEHGKFVFNKKHSDRITENAVYSMIDHLIFITLGEIIIFLGNETLEVKVLELLDGYVKNAQVK